jgi:hypothetical protein
VIDGVLEATDPTQLGRENRVTPTAACGAPKAYPGNNADMTGLHLFDVHRFVNTSTASACFNFSLMYEPTCGLQRYMTAYTTYDPANIGDAYVGDVGAALVPPQTMAFTVEPGASVDVVVFAIDIAPAGVGPYRLTCTTTTTGAAGAGGALQTSARPQQKRPTSTRSRSR